MIKCSAFMGSAVELVSWSLVLAFPPVVHLEVITDHGNEPGSYLTCTQLLMTAFV